MLRRKLLLIFGPLVLLLIATAAGAIWLLEDVLQDIRQIDEQAWVIVEQVNDLSITVNSIETKLYELHSGRQKHLDDLIEQVNDCQNLVEQISRSPLAAQTGFAGIFNGIRWRMPQFVRQLGAMATAQDRALAQEHLDRVLDTAVELRQATLPLSQLVRQRAHTKQESLVTRFRWLVLGLSMAFLMEINIAMLVLIWTAGLVLHPVDRLLSASRALTRGEFDHRVRIEAKGEFRELADAFNGMAGQLQETEKRRMEILGQIALTLNHELNNAMAVIELKIEPLLRQPGASPVVHQSCGQIRANLARMARTVESLKHVRRIVLTDYAQGLKMLDLEQSVRPAEQHTDGKPAPGEDTGDVI